MRFCRYDTPKGPTWAQVVNDLVQPLDAPPWAGGLPAGAAVPLDGARLLAPVAPSKVVCVGRNYADHAAELGNLVPDDPMLFLKAPTAIIGPDAPIRLATAERRTDFEGELVVVIGRAAGRVPREAALRYVLGYTCGNDVSDRVLQKKDVQFARAKSFDTYCPLGPWIETDLDPAEALVETYLNGEVRQSASTSLLVFDVPFLVSFVSEVMTLLPGDIIMTGTPAGVGPLSPGDRVEVRIAGLGSLVNPVELRD